MHNRNKKSFMMIVTVVITLMIAGGLTYAWMSQRAAMTTLLTIEPPDTIAIIPTSDSGNELTMLDLDFHENSNDVKKSDGTIHIYRPVCIRSTEPIHQLEVVHTTNLNALSFNIYPAKFDGNEIEFSRVPLSGAYQNLESEDPKLAKDETLENYKDKTHVADKHAYPLYWIAVKCAIAAKCSEVDWQEVESYTELGADQKLYYNTYYVLEISWKETSKETDLFYIMAQNVAE